MSLFRRKLLLGLLKFSDLFILIVGIICTSSIIAPGPISFAQFQKVLSFQISISNLMGIVAMVFVWHIACRCFNLYDSRRLQGYIQEWKDIGAATTTATMFFALGARVFGVGLFTPSFILIFWFLTTFCTIVFRTLLRFFLRRIRVHGRNLRLVLIAGTNERAYAFARSVKENRELGYYVIGYIDDFLYSPNGGKVNLLGTLDDLRRIIREHVVDEVIIALPIKSQYEKIQTIIGIAEEQGVVTRCLWNPFNTKVGNSADLAVFAGFPVVEMTSRMQQHGRPLVKRITDIVLGLLLMVLTFPVMLAASILVKLTSPGPVFFVQDRVGYNKRIFRLYKLRTMRQDAAEAQKELEARNEMDGPVFKIKNDPRVTTVGRWLRRTSIDELPQLYNVVRGDMSLVGPRPLPIRDYNGFCNDWQRRRFSVRPGLTCLWQVNGRNETSFEDWMRLDLEYIDNWSIFGDFKILAKTVPVVFLGSGAM
jgi:exopolysaccharide biosynthesis polyprenyl glycosylphosphotransferase